MCHCTATIFNWNYFVCVLSPPLSWFALKALYNTRSYEYISVPYIYLQCAQQPQQSLSCAHIHTYLHTQYININLARNTYVSECACVTIFENKSKISQRDSSFNGGASFVNVSDANAIAKANIEQHIKTGSYDLYQFAVWPRLFSFFPQILIRSLAFYSFIHSFIPFIGSNGEISASTLRQPMYFGSQSRPYYGAKWLPGKLTNIFMRFFLSLEAGCM